MKRWGLGELENYREMEIFWEFRGFGELGDFKGSGTDKTDGPYEKNVFLGIFCGCKKKKKRV